MRYLLSARGASLSEAKHLLCIEKALRLYFDWQAALTPRGRIDGLGWVNHEEDENLENALNALNYHDANPGLLNTRVILSTITA